MRHFNLHITAIPSDPHFREFASHPFLQGIRMNGLLFRSCDLKGEIAAIPSTTTVPLWFDAKGRQLRVEQTTYHESHLELVLNHQIQMPLPHPIIFKAGEDWAFVEEITDGNRLRLRSDGHPRYRVKAGDSIHFRDDRVQVLGDLFTDDEKDKIAMARSHGYQKYYLSYTESLRDLEEFQELVGKDAEIILKIESRKGLEFVAKYDYRKHANVRLMAARGDLYVEVEKPHHILEAQKLVIQKDPRAIVGSRMMLSLFSHSVPACSDICEVELLRSIGYNSFLLCDDLCKSGEALGRAIATFEALEDSMHTKGWAK